MARKVNPDDGIAVPAKPVDGADDLAILHPDVELTLAGRKVTVREYRFIDGLRVRARAKPLIDEIDQLMKSGAATEATDEECLDLLARHDVLIRQLMADSIENADPDWIDSLSEPDGEQLLMTWWSVCGRFFVRLVMRRLAERIVAQARRQNSAGATSLPGSSPRATVLPPNSVAGTPSVN